MSRPRIAALRRSAGGLPFVLFAVVVAAIFSAFAGCRRKPTPTSSPPPGRPDDVRIEVVVRDPAASWARVRTMLGMAAWALPRTPFGLLSESGRVPPRVESKIEPGAPLVAVLCEGVGSSRPEEAFAWHAGDPERLPRIDPDRFVLGGSEGGVRWLRARAGATSQSAPSAPMGIAAEFFVAGASEALVAAHVDYLLGALAKVETDVDVRIDVDARAVHGSVVEHALDAVASFGTSLDREGAPPSMTKAGRDVAAFVLAVRAVPAGRALRVEVSLDGDRIHLVAAPEKSASTTLDVSGEVVRLWAAANVGTAISHAFDSPF